MSDNAAIADCLRRIARLLEVTGADKFRVLSHEKAARSIEGLTIDLAALAGDRRKLLEIDGIGPKIADKIAEFCTTGRMKELDDLAAQVPAGVVELMSISGLGPKSAAVFWKEGGITSLAQLKAAIADGSLAKLPRMGAKSVEKLKDAITLAEQSSVRLPLGLALPVAERVVAFVKTIPGVLDACYAGSLRRGRETIGDIDVLASAKAPDHAPIFAAFRAMPGVVAVLASGETRCSVHVAIGPAVAAAPIPDTDALDPATLPPPGKSIQVDLRILEPTSWGAALMYFTGSKEHNVLLRERALKMGYTLNDYGLFPVDRNAEGEREAAPHKRGVKSVAGATEQDVFAALKLPWIPPEIREAADELDLPATPRLLELADIKAELHAHTVASDGVMTIEELAARAKERGFHTLAITDHSKSSFQARGLTVERLLAHVEAVRKAAEKIKGIQLLAGSEVDILTDGALDYDDKTLALLDIVVASPHAALTQDPAKATARLLAAVRHPRVNILGHPTGRLINRRPGLSPDMNAIIAAAVEHNVALEINAHWHRLDLRDTHVRAAVKAGALIAVDCDVHEPDDFDNLRFGVLTARRGWVTPDRCINTWDAKKLRDWLR
jgi:DNA polymerase (family 10)